MTALIITASVIAGVVGWLFLAATAVRWFDLASENTSGMDRLDREMAWLMGLLIAPAAFTAAGVTRIARTASVSGRLGTYTRPKRARSDRDMARYEELRSQAETMRSLSAGAKDQAERRILTDTAKSLDAQADAILRKR